MGTNDLDDIPFDKTPPMYGPELPDWWQLALAGYEVACHIPTGFIYDRYQWRPDHPPQFGADWFLVAVGTFGVVFDEYDDGQLEWDDYVASFWARRPPHVKGPTAQTFTEIKQWASAEPIELEAASVRNALAVHWGDRSDEVLEALTEAPPTAPG